MCGDIRNKAVEGEFGTLRRLYVYAMA